MYDHDRKTGTIRVTWLSMARPFLSVWRAAYPGGAVEADPVFINLRTRPPPADSAVYTIVSLLADAVRAAASEAGSRSPFPQVEGYDHGKGSSIATGRKAGPMGPESTQMQGVYVHLSGRDVVDSFKRGRAFRSHRPPLPLPDGEMYQVRRGQRGGCSCVYRVRPESERERGGVAESSMKRQMAAALSRAGSSTGL